jgi:hypothetical protein
MSLTPEGSAGGWGATAGRCWVEVGLVPDRDPGARGHVDVGVDARLAVQERASAVALAVGHRSVGHQAGDGSTMS